MPYKGSALQVLKYNLLVILLFGFAASAGLMGANWAYLFITALIAMAPVALLVTAVLAWANRFSFDDGRRVLVKPGGRGIPYDQVRGVYVTDRGRSVDVFVRRGWMHMTSLVEALDARGKQQLLEELNARFPDRMRTRGRWSSFAPVITILSALVISLAAAHVFLYQRYPQLSTRPGMLERVEPGKGKARPPLEYLDAFGFTPPPGYRYVGEYEGELYFEDRPNRMRLKAVTGIDRPIFHEQALLFRYGMGVADYGDLMTLAYRSRAGVIPLFLKALDLADMEQAAVYEIGPPVRGFVTQGKRDDEEMTHIVLLGGRANEEVHFFFTGPKRVPESTVQRFVTSVELVKLPGT